MAGETSDKDKSTAGERQTVWEGQGGTIHEGTIRNYAPKQATEILTIGKRDTRQNFQPILVLLDI